MDIIKTGIGLTKTIRNVSRLREIVLVFAKHGFDEFISFGVSSKIPNFVLPKSKRSIKDELDDNTDWSKILGNRLRLCFEELGPAFIKFGQILSSREDIFDPSFIEEMQALRDKVRPVPFAEVRATIEEALGKPIDIVFEKIDENAIGTASIGVVFKGKLKNGDNVVLKVKRPGIEKMMATDFSILKFLALQAEKVSEDVRFLGVSRIVRDFSASLSNELNFNIECLNCKRFKQIVEIRDREKVLKVPEVYEELSSRDLLVMERLEGTPFSNQKEIQKQIKTLEPKLDESLKVFMKTFLQDGFFHADLHGGNFFFLKNEKIGIIDFGLMGTLSKKGRKNFIAIIYSLITFNYENVVYEFLDVASYNEIPDVDSLIEDVRDALSPYIGLTVQQTDFSEVLKVTLSTLKKHQIFLPREWFIVFRALITLDGVGRSLGLDYDIYAIMEEDIQSLISGAINKEDLIEESIWAAKDLIGIARILPRHLKWYLKHLSQKKYGIQLIHAGHEDAVDQIYSALVFVSFTILTCVFIGSGVTFMKSLLEVTSWRDVPTITWIFWCLGGISFLKGFWTLNRVKSKN